MESRLHKVFAVAGNAAASGVIDLRTVAWGALWFLVVVVFTAGVGVITVASSAGEMPPLTPNIQTVIGEQPTGPSRAPEIDVVRAG